ncbi:MAG: oligopeptide transporter, OPT family [bacterium]
MEKEETGKPEETGRGREVHFHEITLRAIVLGIVIGILFGAANAYLGLKVGITVSASIPAAVMGVSVFRALQRMRVSSPAGVLENNMVQTIGSAGESLAAGIIFTVPALILLGFSPGVLKIFVLGSIGGILGILFMVPLRHYLIEKEHGKLIYPEGTACASVLVAGEEGGGKGWLVFSGLGLGMVYEFVMSGFGLWKAKAAWSPARVDAMQFSAESSPALLGVGYVIGPRIAAVIFGGGALSWLVFIPAIKLFAGGNPEPVYPAQIPISEMEAPDIWNHYMRYIGAGAVVFGGIVTLVRSIPLIGGSFRAVFGGAVESLKKVDAAMPPKKIRDLPGGIIVGGLIACGLAIVFLPRSVMPGNAAGALLAIVFSFFFVAVSSRIVGLIGSSSNPVSGMTIAALLATTLVYKLLGFTSESHQAAALAVGALVCISTAVAGDTSQDLKTGYLVGATPWKQQSMEIIGVLTSAAVIGFVVLRLHEAYGIGSEVLPAPQATLMSMVVKGVLSGELPWALFLIGVFTAGVIEVMGLPSLPFAVGLYLPLSMSSPIFMGGLLRYVIDKVSERREGRKEKGEAESEADRLVTNKGVLFASGLIAGSAFVGMAVGLIYSMDKGAKDFMEGIKAGPEWAGGFQDLVSLIALLVVGLVLFVSAWERKS